MFLARSSSFLADDTESQVPRLGIRLYFALLHSQEPCVADIKCEHDVLGGNVVGVSEAQLIRLERRQCGSRRVVIISNQEHLLIACRILVALSVSAKVYKQPVHVLVRSALPVLPQRGLDFGGGGLAIEQLAHLVEAQFAQHGPKLARVVLHECQWLELRRCHGAVGIGSVVGVDRNDDRVTFL